MTQKCIIDSDMMDLQRGKASIFLNYPDFPEESRRTNMKFMNKKTVSAINSALLLSSGTLHEVLQIRPWQYVQMQYARVGLPAPSQIPSFDSLEQADFWMCLDSRYNAHLRQISNPIAC